MLVAGGCTIRATASHASGVTLRARSPIGGTGLTGTPTRGYHGRPAGPRNGNGTMASCGERTAGDGSIPRAASGAGIGQTGTTTLVTGTTTRGTLGTLSGKTFGR